MGDFVLTSDAILKQRLLLNFYMLLNDNGRFSDHDVSKLHLAGINRIEELYWFFMQQVSVADFFLTIVSPQVQAKGKNKTEFLSIIIRFVDLHLHENVIPVGCTLCLTGDLDIARGVVNVKNFFLTRMNKKRQNFETMAMGIEVESNDNFNRVAKIEHSIFTSQNLEKIDLLSSMFDVEREKWERYLDFQEKVIELNRNQSAFYFDYKTENYYKISCKYRQIAKNHNSSIPIRQYFYVPMSGFELPSEIIDYENVTVHQFIVMVRDDDHALKLSKIIGLSPVGIFANKNLNGDNFDLTEFKLDEANFIDDDRNMTSSIYCAKKSFAEINTLLSNCLERINAMVTERSAGVDLLIRHYNECCFYDMWFESLVVDDTTKVSDDYGYLCPLSIGEATLVRRGRMVLDKLAKNDVANPYLINYIFNLQNLRLLGANNKLEEQIVWSDIDLNDEQREAVGKALASRDIFILQGPPGTGKTQFITELIYQYCIRGQKVLVSSQNHTAINNVMSRIGKNPKALPLRLSNENRNKNHDDYALKEYQPNCIVFNYYRFLYEYLQRRYQKKWTEQRLNLPELNAKFDLIKMHYEKWNALQSQISELKNNLAVLKKDVFDLENKQLTERINDGNLLVLRNDLFNFLELLNQPLSILIPHSIRMDEIFNEVFGKFINLNGLKLPNDNQALSEWFGSLDCKIANCDESLWEGIDSAGHCQWTLLQEKWEDVKNNFKSKIISEIKDCDKKLRINHEESAKVMSDNSKIKEIESTQVTIADLESKTQNTTVMIANLLSYLNEVYGLHLNSHDWQNDFFGLTSVIAKINDQQSKNDNQKMQVFVENILKRLQDNYDIEKLIANHDLYFNEKLLNDTRLYSNELLDHNVNIVAVTATSNQKYLHSKNKQLQNSNLFDIDLKRFNFDVIVIDEVSKLTPMEIFMPLVYGKTVVLVGDYRQLPPVFKYSVGDIAAVNTKFNTNYSYQEFDRLMGESMFKYLISNVQSSAQSLLKKQYRCCEDIMEIVNVFYNGQLQLGLGEKQNSIHRHFLKSINADGKLLFSPDQSIYWLDSSRDVNGQPVLESGELNSTSLFNWLEIELTCRALKEIDDCYKALHLDVAPTVGVISFYRLHVNKLKQAVQKMKLQAIFPIISTVDDFQGRECDIVIVNTVRNPRSKTDAKQDFVKRYERINVAFSRAQALLIIVGAVDFFAYLDVMLPDINHPDKSQVKRVYYEILQIINRSGKILTIRDFDQEQEER